MIAEKKEVTLNSRVSSMFEDKGLVACVQKKREENLKKKEFTARQED